jgi:ABC-type nitrate/sulfonate/bicarbonate transport system substrate-binding protein
MALVQRPLAAVIAQPGVRSPRDLEGRRVGVTGLPSDEAVLRSVVQGGGGDPERVRVTTIGFNAVASLLARRVSAATAFWNVEGLALKRRRPGFREFRVDDFGAPSYPELVLAVSRETLRDRPSVIRAALRGIARGYETTRRDPEGSVGDLLSRVRGADRAELLAQLDAVGPAFTAGADRFGELDEKRLREWAAWEVRFGIVEKRPDVDQAFEGRYVPTREEASAGE